MRASLVLALAVLPGWLVAASAQSENRADAAQQPPAHTYRGAFVCGKLPASADILHVPADLVIRGNQVQFGRPLLNLRTQVVGSEQGLGSVDGGGAIKIASTWSFRGILAHGAYEGTLTRTGGTLAGTQTWQRPDGTPRSRTCQVALVPTGR